MATMQWEFVVALIVAIPLILFPAAFVWYLNVGGIYQTVRRLAARRATRRAVPTSEVTTAQANGAGRKDEDVWNLIFLP